MAYTVNLEKTYYNIQDPEETRTITGEIEVSADSQEDANRIVATMILGGLQTIDPRITWYDTESVSDSEWTYEDFTFGLGGTE